VLTPVARALGDDLDRAVGTVGGAAGQAEVHSLAADEPPEADALDPTVDAGRHPHLARGGAPVVSHRIPS
jgi:hypothetical protein